MISFGIVGGTGSSLIFIPAFTAPGHYFLRKRGMATGMATTGGSIGGVIFPLVLDNLIPKVGFPWACRVLGFINLFLVLFANVLIKSRLPPAPDANSRPSLHIFSQPAFTLITIGAFLMELALFVPIGYIVSYAIYEGINTSLAYQLLAILNGGSFFGRWFSGHIADHLGRFNTLIILDFLCLASTAGLWLPAGNSAAMMVIYAAFFGFASGSNISLTPVCIGQLCKTEQYGRYYATCYTVCAFGYVIPLERASNPHYSFRSLTTFSDPH